MKLKAKLKGDSAEIKVMALHQQMGREEAETKKGTKNYITHLTAKVGDRVVFQASMGPFISKDPYFKFDVAGVKKGDTVDVDWVDLSGATKKESIAIK
ncbi:MAG: thiosulfate oxidation carrier complex protein SoxZ [Sulfuricurvum sp.]